MGPSLSQPSSQCCRKGKAQISQKWLGLGRDLPEAAGPAQPGSVVTEVPAPQPSSSQGSGEQPCAHPGHRDPQQPRLGDGTVLTCSSTGHRTLNWQRKRVRLISLHKKQIKQQQRELADDSLRPPDALPYFHPAFAGCTFLLISYRLPPCFPVLRRGSPAWGGTGHRWVLGRGGRQHGSPLRGSPGRSAGQDPPAGAEANPAPAPRSPRGHRALPRPLQPPAPTGVRRDHHRRATGGRNRVTGPAAAWSLKGRNPLERGRGGRPCTARRQQDPKSRRPGSPRLHPLPAGTAAGKSRALVCPLLARLGRAFSRGSTVGDPGGGQDPRPRQPQPGWGRASERARAGPARQRPATAPPLVWIRAASKEGLGNAFTYAHLRLPEEKGRIVPPGSGYKPEPGQWGFFFLKKQTKNPQKIQTNPTNKHKNTPHQKPNANKKQTTKTSLNQ